MSQKLSSNSLTQMRIERCLKRLKPRLAQQYYVAHLGYFGSYARGEQKEDSDLDLLIHFAKPLGWEFFDLQDLLEQELQIEVDLVSYHALKPQLKPYILKDIRYI